LPGEGRDGTPPPGSPSASRRGEGGLDTTHTEERG
jgi:hypothetical protein